ncbi:hypothetical protein [Allorhizocola rhizosphaerae]|uniref:hypothetical protein n=1 Tax=Allorhizocola rhizosphaerae TaxID=1872709 RepID=UPI0013C32AED|nr:hypothetical protein [Allorhizocola rhizosphaerae]
MPWDATAAYANDKADNGLNGNTFSGMRFYRIGNRWQAVTTVGAAIVPASGA